MLKTSPTKQALVCGCGYRARDDDDMAAHLLRSGAYEDKKRGRIRLLPDKAHAEPRKDNDNGINSDRLTNGMSQVSDAGVRRSVWDSAIHPRNWRLPSDDGVAVSSLPRRLDARRKESDKGRAWLVLTNLGVLGFLTSVVLLSFGPGVMALLLAGPLAPWAGGLTWAWQHGEVSLPVVVLLALMPALPWTRRALGRGISRGLELMGTVMVWLLIAVVVLGFGAWLWGFVWILIVPGLK